MWLALGVFIAFRWMCFFNWYPEPLGFYPSASRWRMELRKRGPSLWYLQLQHDLRSTYHEYDCGSPLFKMRLRINGRVQHELRDHLSDLKRNSGNLRCIGGTNLPYHDVYSVYRMTSIIVCVILSFRSRFRLSLRTSGSCIYFFKRPHLRHPAHQRQP